MAPVRPALFEAGLPTSDRFGREAYCQAPAITQRHGGDVTLNLSRRWGDTKVMLVK